jgi:Fur family transcriptional regulator, ferric uptake regulator
MGDRLRGAGLRRTPVRVAVLQRLATARKPLAANDLIARLGPETDAVTVYRTLNTLAEHNLLHRVRGEDGAWRYATSASPVPGPDNHADHPHAHFVCDECGGVECLEEVPVPANPLGHNRRRRRYDVRCAEVVVHGTCPKCHDD